MNIVESFAPESFLNSKFSIKSANIIDRYHSVPFFISNRPSVSIRTCFFRHYFRNGEKLERSDSKSDTRRIG